MKAKVTRGKPKSPLHLTQRTWEAFWGYICILPWVLGFLIFLAGPMVFSLRLSFFNADYITKSVYVGLGNYQRMFSSSEIWLLALRNTAVYTFSSVPLHVVLALLVAILLNQQVRGLAFWRTIFYLPAVVQGVAVSVLWIWLFNPDYGPINGMLKLVGVHNPPLWIWSENWAMPALVLMSTWGVGGSMIVFLAGLQGVPQHLYDAASIDGAGIWQRFRHVTLPMMTPTIFFSLIMGLIGAWQTFTTSYVMTDGGPNNATLTAALLIYRRAFRQFQFGYASALAWVLLAVILVFTLLGIRSAAGWVYYEGEVAK
jgi:multiple sugar transport system permease protein